MRPLDILVPFREAQSMMWVRVNLEGNLCRRCAVLTMKAFSSGKCQTKKRSCPNLTPAEDMRKLQADVTAFFTNLGCFNKCSKCRGNFGKFGSELFSQSAFKESSEFIISCNFFTTFRFSRSPFISSSPLLVSATKSCFTFFSAPSCRARRTWQLFNEKFMLN